MDLVCPKCRGAMNSYERSGITIDQCSECRGVFLDRGELERLIDADAAFVASAAAATAPAAPSAPAAAPAPARRSAAPVYGTPPGARDEQYPPPQYREQGYREQGYREPYREQQRYDYDSDRTPYPGSQGYYKKKRKRSFLEDLFD